DGLVTEKSAKGVKGAKSPRYDVTIPIKLAHMNMKTLFMEASSPIQESVLIANRVLYNQVKNYLQQEVLSVTTGQVTNITTTTADCAGNVTSDGGAAIIASGVCWSTSENPTVSNSKTTDGADLGPYTSHITGLSSNTTYYVRAYATNAEGTAYGEEQRTIKTLPVSDIEYGSLTDSRDGNVYKTITIDDKVWMAENLKYLPEVVGPATNSNTTSCYYVYGYDGTDVNAAKSTANYQTYGVLYNWPAAMNGAATSNTIPSSVQGACPAGWHLPSDAEWKQLEMYLGMSQSEADKTGWRGTDEGGKMKHPGTEYWGEPNTGATNSSGFTALPGGLLINNGIFGNMHVGGHWWSSTQYVDEVAWWRIFLYDESKVNRGQQPKSLGLSVRCIKDYQKEPGSSPDYGTFTDQRDQTVYKTITIGDKEWMAENLKYLPEVVGPATNSNTTSCYYVYGYDGTDVNAAKATENYQTYGVLYNWPAAMNGAATSNTIPSGVQGACPAGWHLPSDAEWKQLEMYLGMLQSEADKTGWRGTDEGGKMKHPGTEYWGEPNTGATNSSGFTALPGGLLINNGIFGDMHVGGHWWSSTQYVEEVAWWRIFLYDESKVNRGQQPKSLGLSVRCIKD
ncbi:MAG: FISUMP domain-containing protein, partial [Sphaerochaetaceae bacterium]|nr:FISUMP domain-containing protein [Sphaerochaetaceae bacterium]MDD3945768.1 FISUMP domain-containing protein [Bacteroidales bacterium]